MRYFNFLNILFLSLILASCAEDRNAFNKQPDNSIQEKPNEDIAGDSIQDNSSTPTPVENQNQGPTVTNPIPPNINESVPGKEPNNPLPESPQDKADKGITATPEPTTPAKPGIRPTPEPTTPAKPGIRPTPEPTTPAKPGTRPTPEPTTPTTSGIRPIPGNTTPATPTVSPTPEIPTPKEPEIPPTTPDKPIPTLGTVPTTTLGVVPTPVPTSVLGIKPLPKSEQILSPVPTLETKPGPVATPPQTQPEGVNVPPVVTDIPVTVKTPNEIFYQKIPVEHTDHSESDLLLKPELEDCKGDATPLMTNTLPEPQFSLYFDSTEDIVNNQDLVFLDAKGNTITKNKEEYFELAEGKEERALTVVNSLLGIPIEKVINFDAGTISLWIQPENDLGTVSLLNTDLLGGDDKQFSFFTPTPERNSLRLNWSNSGTVQGLLIPISPLKKKEWHHLAVSWKKGSNLSVYLDGLLIKQVITPDNFLPSKGSAKYLYLSSGRYRTAYYPSKGDQQIDAFYAFDRELTPQEIGNLYTNNILEGAKINAGELQMRFGDKSMGYAPQIATDNGTPINSPLLKSWLTQFINIKDPTKLIDLTNISVNPGDVICKQDPNTKSILLRYPHINLPKDSGDSQDQLVTIDSLFVPNEEENEIGKSINVFDNARGWSLEKVSLYYGGIKPLSPQGKTDRLIQPNILGSDIPNPFSTKVPLTNYYTQEKYPSALQAMQWKALYSADGSGNGYYFGAHDPKSGMKSLRYETNLATSPDSDNASINMRLDIYPEGMRVAGNDYVQNWQFFLGLQKNNPYDLAQRYRRFALGQRWMAPGPLATRKYKPQKMMDASYFSPSIYDTAKSYDDLIKNKVKSLPENHPLKKENTGWVWQQSGSWQIASRTHRYANNQFIGAQMNDSPTIVPDTPYITNEWNRAKQDGVGVGIYTLTFQWDAAIDVGIPDEPDPWRAPLGFESAMKGPDQSCLFSTPKNNNWYGRPCDSETDPEKENRENKLFYSMYDMCPVDPAWQKKIKSNLEIFAEDYQVDGVYDDARTAANPSLCFAKNHGHLPGGGSHYVDGYRDILEDELSVIREKNPNFTVYSEAFSDAYLDLVPGYHLFDWVPTENIDPVTMMIYHDYALFMSRSVYLASEVESAWYAKQGQFFAWGGMLGPLNPNGVSGIKLANIKNYLADLSILRRYYQDYLVTGQMLAPVNALKLSVAPPTSQLGATPGDAEVMPIISYKLYTPETITAIEADPNKTPNDKARLKNQNMVHPQVEVTAWKAYNGKTGIVAANLLTDHGTSIFIPLDRKKLRLDNKEHTVKIIRLETTQTLPQPLTNQEGIIVNLSPKEALLVEIE